MSVTKEDVIKFTLQGRHYKGRIICGVAQVEGDEPTIILGGKEPCSNIPLSEVNERDIN